MTTVNSIEPKVPTDLRKVLAAAPKAASQWRDLMPIGRRDFISWIESAKQEETRKRRVESVPSRLASGKRRPCCFAVVPMNFYTALGGTPKAKAIWRNLTPMEKREFVGWIEAAQDSNTRKDRMEKACLMLAAGKRRP